jgi:hypothetical protein
VFPSSQVKADLQVRTGGRPLDELLSRIWSEDSAQDVAEYVLLAVLIAGIAVLSLTSFAGDAITVLSQAASALTRP